MNYGEIVRRRRVSRGWTQERLADEAQLGRRGRLYILNLEAGHIQVPGSDKWLPICKALQIDPANGADLRPEVQGITVSAVPSSPDEGIRMVKRADGTWAPFLISEDPAKYDDGTVLDLRDRNGTIIRVEVITVRGRKWVVPAE